MRLIHDDFVERRVRGLVKVDHTGGDVRLEVAVERSASLGDGGVMRRANEHCIVC